MSTISKVNIPDIADAICQGDIFKNVRFNYIDAEDNSNVDIIEYEFPLAIVISQACDVIGMDKIMADQGGKPTKFMPAILMCPIYDKNIVKTGDHLSEVFSGLELDLTGENVYQKDDFKIAERDWHYRFHALEIALNGKTILNNAIVDFKHYFTVPISYLRRHTENRMYHMEDLFSEQLTLKFATYLSRVAIP